MADYNSTLYTELTAGVLAAGGNTTFRSVNPILITVEAPTGVAGTETINIGKLGLGSIVRPTLGRVITDGAGTSVIIDLGDSVDPDRYIDGLNVSTLGVLQFCSPAIPDGVANPHSVTEATSDLILTVASMTTWPANSKLYIELFVEN